MEKKYKDVPIENRPHSSGVLGVPESQPGGGVDPTNVEILEDEPELEST